MAAATGMQPTSPAPRTPSGVTGEGTAVCMSSIVSEGLSKPTTWVPGIEPARVDETSTGPLNPADVIGGLRRDDRR